MSNEQQQNPTDQTPQQEQAQASKQPLNAKARRTARREAAWRTDLANPVPVRFRNNPQIGSSPLRHNRQP